MLLTTFAAHPLLSKLPPPKHNSDYAAGLHGARLTAVNGVYKIGVEELRKVFAALSQSQNVAACQHFLTFPYDSLRMLDSTHPFHIPAETVIGQKQLLEQLQFANYFRHANVALKMLEHLSAWISANDTPNDDIFTPDKAYFLAMIATYRPDIAFRHLHHALGDAHVLTRVTFQNKNYRLILEALSNLAVTNRYFSFAAKQLLHFTAAEVGLGTFEEEYQAYPYFCELFVNACSGLESPLLERRKFLEQALNLAETPRDYRKLFILAKTLGRAASVYNAGVHQINPLDSDYYETYIEFAVYQLLRLAGAEDEDGLNLTAQEELHALLNETIDDLNVFGTTEVPFIILRYYIEYQCDWNLDPFFSLKRLDQQIIDLKSDEDPVDPGYLHGLELRLEQLISLFADREFLSSQFSLWRGAKQPKKACEIGDDTDQQTTRSLHERQSLAERLIFSGTTNIHDIDRGWPKTTYIVANFGVVITNIPHQKGGDHQRLFITVPINVEGFSITGCEYTSQGHAEEALYDFLMKPENLKILIAKIQVQLRVDTLAGHKIYALIIDMHGTYDMCESCSSKGLEFQDRFRVALSEYLPKLELRLPSQLSTRFPIVLRYSSDIRYHYHNNPDPKKRGAVVTLENCGTKRDMDPATPGEDYQCDQDRDIRHYGANLVIHGKTNWHLFWNEARRAEAAAAPALRLERWTAFTTGRSMRDLSVTERRQSYTGSDGTVDTRHRQHMSR